MIATNVRRPRNVDVPRAAAILYGDWGASKAYVIGLAFAVGAYSSFWLIAAMCILTAPRWPQLHHHLPALPRWRRRLCQRPASLRSHLNRRRFRLFSIWASRIPRNLPPAAIVAIGLLNLLGPKHTGGLAFLIAVPTALVVLVLGAFSLPHLGFAVHQLQPLRGSLLQKWQGFVGIVLALSGVEAIANATGVMRLNPGSTEANPSDIAATLGASRLILGAPRRHAMTNLLRGNLVREVSDALPEETDLLVYA